MLRTLFLRVIRELTSETSNVLGSCAVVPGVRLRIMGENTLIVDPLALRAYQNTLPPTPPSQVYRSTDNSPFVTVTDMTPLPSFTWRILELAGKRSF